jgi:hypothetical protein
MNFKWKLKLVSLFFFVRGAKTILNEKLRTVIKTGCTYMYGFQFQMIRFRSSSKEISTLDKYKKHSAGTCGGHMGMGPSTQSKFIVQLKDRY